jgi:type II secretory pathway pseudopilin PulG
MRYNLKKHRPALTLIEIMVVVLIIAIAVIGAMGFRSFCVTDAKRADVQVNAARIASMVLENWKAKAGAISYDPTTTGDLKQLVSQYTISTSSSTSAPAPVLTNVLGKYQVRDIGYSASIYYYVTLSYQTDTYVTTTPVTVQIRAMNVSISWNQKYGTTGSTGKTISMTTYTDL